MNSNNLIFSSKIDVQVEDICFQILNDALIDEEFEKVYVKNVVLAGKQVIFFTEIQDKETIIRVPLKTY